MSEVTSLAKKPVMLTAMLINITVHNFIFPVLASTSAACLHKTGFKQLKFQFLAVLMAQTAVARAAAADITTTSRFDYTGSQSAALIRLVSLRPYLPRYYLISFRWGRKAAQTQVESCLLQSPSHTGDCASCSCPNRAGNAIRTAKYPAK